MNIFLPANSKNPTCVLKVQKNKSLRQKKIIIMKTYGVAPQNPSCASH